MSADTTLKSKAHKKPYEPEPLHTLRVLFAADGGVVDEPVRILESGAIEIGRSVTQGGILLADPRVSRVHARLMVTRAEVRLEDLSSTGTRVDGREVQTAVLQDGSILQLGNSFLCYRVHREPNPPTSAPSIVGTAPSMHEVRRMVELIANSPATVLISGETGSGKEIVSRAIHEASGRRGPFLAVNCGAIATSLAESELFGHVAGAFTGARGPSPGYFRAAEGGTLLLDEIGEMTAELQPKLLRAIEERAVIPVGAARPVPCDVRILAATHRDLSAAVRAGTFRTDLYARLSELTLALPRLCDRREDVLLLLRHLYEGELPRLAPDLVEALLLHRWPLNVREVRMVATRIALAAARQGVPVRPEALTEHFERMAAIAPVEENDHGDEEGPILERDELVALLREHGGVVADVARAARRSRRQVYRWMQRHGISASDYRR